MPSSLIVLPRYLAWTLLAAGTFAGIGSGAGGWAEDPFDGAISAEGVTIDPTTTDAYRARRVWHPKPAPAATPTRPYPCRIVSYADKWTRHGLSNYMSWRLANGPLAARQQWQIPRHEQLVHREDYDVDGDGKTEDDYVAAHVFSLDTPLSNPRWPLHMAYPERFNEIFYGGAAWYLADTEPGTHRVWVEQGYNPDHSPPWFDRRAEDHPLQGQANEYEIGSGLRMYWAILWKKEDFLNDGAEYRVTFDDDSRLAAITARGYWLGYNDVRLLVQDGDRLFISDTSQYEVPVRGYPPPANGRVFCVVPTKAAWAEYHPRDHLIHFEPSEADFKHRQFNDVQAVGWYLAKHSLKTGSQAHLKWYGFEADAVVHRPEEPSVHIQMAQVPAGEQQPAFWISTCEVPYAFWKRIHRWGNAPFNTLQKRYVYRKFGDMGSMVFEPADSRRAFSQDEPVTSITFYDALAWCNTLSEYEGKTPCYYLDSKFAEVFKNQHLWTRVELDEEGRRTKRVADVPEPRVYIKWDADGHRLPTETEWRAAYIAGETREEPGSANVGAVSGHKTAEVGSRKPNALGIHDMIGNVWESVWNYGDCYDPAKHTRITMLGGDFNHPADPAAAPSAVGPYGDRPLDGGGNIGLRLVCRKAGQPKPSAGGAVTNVGYYDSDVPTWVVAKGTKTAARANADTVKEPILDIVRVPGGTFLFSPGKMLPIEVTVHPFQMARYTTTFGKWNYVCHWAAAHGYRFSHTGDMGSMYWYLFDHCPQEPVTHITWFDITAWCNALSEMEGRTPCYYADRQRTQVYRQAMVFRPGRMSGREAVRRAALEKLEPLAETIGGETDARIHTRWDADGYRLPTLAEYEFAARGGGSSRDYWGKDDRNEYSWSIFNSGGRTHPAGQKKPNRYGLYDINGNVTHWIHSTDRPAPDRPPLGDVNNPKMEPFSDDPAHRVTGPLAVGDSLLKSGVTDYHLAFEMYYPDVGFRVVRCQAGTHPRDGKEPLKRRAEQPRLTAWATPRASAESMPARGPLGTRLNEPDEPVRFTSFASRTSRAAEAISTDACWRGNLHRTGEYPTGGVPKLKGLRWKFSTGGKVRSGPVVFDGVVCVGSDGGGFHAIDVNSGKERWNIAVPGGVRSSACVAGGMVYFGGNDGKLYAADAKTGKTEWTVQSRGYLSSAPLMSHGMLLLSGPVGLDPKTGKQVWGPRGVRLNGFQRAIERSVAVVDRYAVEGGGPCDLQSATFLFGGGTWARQVTDAVADGVIYTCQTGVGGGMYGDKGNGTLHAIELRTGKEKWAKITHREGTPQAWREVLMCSPAVHDGVVYIGSEHGELFALDAANGKKLWAFDTKSAIRSAPSISTHDGTLYFGAADGKIFALDAKSGHNKWEFQTEDKIVSSPCPDMGRVYVGSDDGYLYALEAE